MIEEPSNSSADDRSETKMQVTTATPAASQGRRRTRAGLVTAGRRTAAGRVTTAEFAMHAVGCLLLRDLASARCRKSDATA
jgi:hypothetical protein